MQNTGSTKLKKNWNFISGKYQNATIEFIIRMLTDPCVYRPIIYDTAERKKSLYKNTCEVSH